MTKIDPSFRQALNKAVADAVPNKTLRQIISRKVVEAAAEVLDEDEDMRAVVRDWALETGIISEPSTDHRPAA